MLRSCNIRESLLYKLPKANCQINPQALCDTAYICSLHIGLIFASLIFTFETPGMQGCFSYMRFHQVSAPRSEAKPILTFFCQEQHLN